MINEYLTFANISKHSNAEIDSPQKGDGGNIMLYSKDFERFLDSLSSLEDVTFKKTENGCSELPKNRSTMLTDILQRENEEIFLVEMPGVKKEDISIELKKGCLIVKGNYVSECNETDEIVRKERHEGYYARVFHVGDDVHVEDIKAKFENGVLRIAVSTDVKREDKEKFVAID